MSHVLDVEYLLCKCPRLTQHNCGLSERLEAWPTRMDEHMILQDTKLSNHYWELVVFCDIGHQQIIHSQTTHTQNV
jgi:hypothetical protein